MTVLKAPLSLACLASNLVDETSIKLRIEQRCSAALRLLRLDSDLTLQDSRASLRG